jgi:Ca2+-binding RTX toxin-like protein
MRTAEVLRAASQTVDKVTVYGLGGLDTIYAGAGEDTFVPGPGNDVVYARSTVEGGGQKTFVWNAGDGNDTVYYINTEHQPGDGQGILSFGSGIGPEDVEVRNSGNNVVFALTDGSGSVTFVNANTTDMRYRLDIISFADGETWLWSEAAERKVVRGTNAAEVLRAASQTGDKVTVYGLGGLDTMYGGAGEDTFVPGPGNDVVYARSTVEGGGKKTFVWNAGDGNDTIYYLNADHQAGDGMGVLKFGSGIEPEDVEVRNSGNNVVFALLDGSGGVTFVNGNTTDTRYYLDLIRFSDGETWQWGDIADRRVVRGTNIGEVLRAASHTGDRVTVYGLGGLDTIYAGGGEDIIVPGSGNDVVYARSTVEGGGQKTFVWETGDGNDTIYYLNAAHQAGDGQGILRFGSGIASSDVTVRASGSNVVFTAAGGRVTFMGANTDVRRQVDTLHFSNGEVVQWNTMPRQ